MSNEQKPGRGRPRTITPSRIADAGIRLGLANITFTGLAAELGVSHMALYKHVANLGALKQLIAEEVFSRWAIPPACTRQHPTLAHYLQAFTESANQFVRTHPGLSPYLLRRSAATPPMIASIAEHQRAAAEVYGISTEQARWLLSTVAFHCIAVADTVYSAAQGSEEEDEAARTARLQDAAEMEAEFQQGMQALIVGTLAILQNQSTTQEHQAAR